MKHRAIAMTMAVALSGNTPPAFAGTHAQGRVERPATPPGWSEVMSKSLDLTLAGKHTELIAIFEQWVAKYPNFVDARMMLGGAHENLGRDMLRSGVPDARAKSVRHFEAAVAHFRRALELPGADFDAMRVLIDVHGIVGLHRPDEYERLVHEGLKRYPAEPGAHAYLIALLAGKQAPLDGAVRAALAAVPKSAEARATIAGTLYHFAPYDRSNAEAILRVALQFADEALKVDPRDKYALRVKAQILEEQARLRKGG
jgi:tetratricopeptide (TPR) repeat protein